MNVNCSGHRDHFNVFNGHTLLLEQKVNREDSTSANRGRFRLDEEKDENEYQQEAGEDGNVEGQYGKPFEQKFDTGGVKCK